MENISPFLIFISENIPIIFLSFFCLLLFFYIWFLHRSNASFCVDQKNRIQKYKEMELRTEELNQRLERELISLQELSVELEALNKLYRERLGLC